MTDRQTLNRRNNLYIAPNFSDEDWKQLELDNNEESWQVAVSVLKDRLYARYINPIDILVDAESDINPKDKRFGFTTLAIDFLLMETFQAFKDGEIDSKGKSKALFKKYLETSPVFSEYFTTEQQRDDFYLHFRCGILHQAEVQSSALVWSVGDLYDRSNGKEKVNRLFVHRALKSDINSYIELLRKPESAVFRHAFRMKMDAIVARGEQA